MVHTADGHCLVLQFPRHMLWIWYEETLTRSFKMAPHGHTNLSRVSQTPSRAGYPPGIEKDRSSGLDFHNSTAMLALWQVQINVFDTANILCMGSAKIVNHPITRIVPNFQGFLSVCYDAAAILANKFHEIMDRLGTIPKFAMTSVLRLSYYDTCA
jgi:hypothetical protein